MPHKAGHHRPRRCSALPGTGCRSRRDSPGVWTHPVSFGNRAGEQGPSHTLVQQNALRPHEPCLPRIRARRRDRGDHVRRPSTGGSRGPRRVADRRWCAGPPHARRDLLRLARHLDERVEQAVHRRRRPSGRSRGHSDRLGHHSDSGRGARGRQRPLVVVADDPLHELSHGGAVPDRAGSAAAASSRTSAMWACTAGTPPSRSSTPDSTVAVGDCCGGGARARTTGRRPGARLFR